MQEQTTKQRSKSEEQQVEEVPAEVNEQSAAVSEEACCVLDTIDEALTENDERELTADEIYAKGRPSWEDYYDDDKAVELRDTEGIEAFNEYWQETYNAFSDAREKYAEAYETVTGVEFDPCVCG